MKIEPGLSMAVDTNILLAATDTGRIHHKEAVSIFTELPGRGVDLFLATQVIREYLVVSTRPTKNNGLGMTIEDAAANIQKFRKRTVVMPETSNTGELLLKWALRFQVTGKRLHDLQLLATAHEAGVTVLLTSNTADFPKSTGIRILSPGDLKFPAA